MHPDLARPLVSGGPEGQRDWRGARTLVQWIHLHVFDESERYSILSLPSLFGFRFGTGGVTTRAGTGGNA